MASHRSLLAILLGSLLLSSLYNWLIPPFEGPDGPQHFAYIEWLAAGKGFPPQGEAAWETPVQQEASQPPLYYLLASLPAQLVRIDDPPAAFRPNPHFPSTSPGTVPDNKNVAIHYPADTHPMQGGWLALFLARGITTLFGLALITATFSLACELWPGRPANATLAALLIGLTPQVPFLSSVVSNDIPAAATSALVLWILARMVRRGPTTGRGLALGAAFGTAALCKTSTLALSIPIAAGVLWLWLADKTGRRPALRAGLAILMGALTVAGWWYVRSWLLYGTPLGLETHYQAPWSVAAGAERSSPAAEWLEVFYSFWAAFGWGNIKFGGWVYAPLGILTLAAAAGLSLSVTDGWQRKQQSPKTIILVLLGLAVLAVSAALARWMQQVRAPHGRLLFPALPAITILLITGWNRLARWVPWLATGYLGTLALLAPALLLRPAYASPPTALVDGPSLGWRFADVTELLEATPQLRSAAAGQVLPVRVCWRPLAMTERDYSILLQIVGPQDSVIAGRHTYPGLGSYPTSAWEPNQPFCDTIRIDIPANLAHTLVYKVEVGLLDHSTEERLPATGPDGAPLGHTFAAQVRLDAAEPLRATGEPAGSGPIQLLDYHVPPTWHPGESYQLHLTWQATEGISKDYTLYVHLRDPVSNHNIAQADGPPLDDWYPTSWWPAGEVVQDLRSFPLPVDAPPGRYPLVVGWYSPHTGERVGSEHVLAEIEVRP